MRKHSSFQLLVWGNAVRYYPVLGTYKLQRFNKKVLAVYAKCAIHNM